MHHCNYNDNLWVEVFKCYIFGLRGGAETSVAGGQGQFAAEILKLFLEVNRMIAREKINEGHNGVTYSSGDLVIVRVQIQSNTSRNRVAKLSYKSKGPFVIKVMLGYRNYMIQR
jgi:hypothetical protein